MSNVKPREGGPYSLYCYDCGEWVPNTANHEMKKEGFYAHSHICAAKTIDELSPKKPTEHYNWCDFILEELGENSRWYCSHCDSAVEENYNYCPSCGQKLNWD